MSRVGSHSQVYRQEVLYKKLKINETRLLYADLTDDFNIGYDYDYVFKCSPVTNGVESKSSSEVADNKPESISPVLHENDTNKHSRYTTVK